MTLPRILSATARTRGAIDLLWLVAFGAVIVAMATRQSGPSLLRSGVALELLVGGQRKAILRDGVRLGLVEERVRPRPHDRGWVLTQRFHDATGERVGAVELQLHRDLSLVSLGLEADLDRLARLTAGGAGVGDALLNKVLGGRVALSGSCDPQVGFCRVRGTIGTLRVDRRLAVGRGPVLPSAIYPLLARGVLGRTAELTVFDPLTMRTRTLTYEVDGRRQSIGLSAGSARHQALRVQQDIDGVRSEVWLDARGRVLLERLPHGLTVEHLAWLEADAVGGGVAGHRARENTPAGRSVPPAEERDQR